MPALKPIAERLTQLAFDFDDAPKPWSPDSDETKLGWERRLLSDLQDGPMVICFPGFTGAICERLVAKGLATREDAGLMPKPANWPKRAKWERHQQYRYAISDERGQP